MHAREVLGVGKGVLFREVSSVQECPYKEVALYVETNVFSEIVSAALGSYSGTLGRQMDAISEKQSPPGDHTCRTTYTHTQFTNTHTHTHNTTHKRR